MINFILFEIYLALVWINNIIEWPCTNAMFYFLRKLFQLEHSRGFINGCKYLIFDALFCVICSMARFFATSRNFLGIHLRQ